MKDLTDQEGPIDHYGHKASQGVTTSPNLFPLQFTPLPQPHRLPLPWLPTLPAPLSHPALHIQTPTADFSPLNWFNANFNPLYWDADLLAVQILIPQNKDKSQFTSANPTGWSLHGVTFLCGLTPHAPHTVPVTWSPRKDKPAQHEHQQWDAGKQGSTWGCYTLQSIHWHMDGLWLSQSIGQDWELQHRVLREQPTLHGLNLHDHMSLWP